LLQLAPWHHRRVSDSEVFFQFSRKNLAHTASLALALDKQLRKALDEIETAH